MKNNNGNLLKVAVIGYGNIGKACEAALLSAPDMELAGIYHHSGVPDALQADVALLCTPTREVPKYAEK
nr:diaminopimelate dehydrogenase [Bacteroidales bacterium]